MTRTFEQLSKMDPTAVAFYATNEARKSPALRREMRTAWATVQAELVEAVDGARAQGHVMPGWRVVEKVQAARMALLCAIVLGHPREALDAARRAAGLVLLGEDGEPV